MMMVQYINANLNIIIPDPLFDHADRTTDYPTGNPDQQTRHKPGKRVINKNLKIRHDYFPLSLPFFFPGVDGFASKIFRSSCFTFQREYSKRFIFHSRTRPEYSGNFPCKTNPAKMFDHA